MQVLSIGNSFSEDAQRYLHDIAKCDGVRLDSFNLMIGGCPLSLHYRNMLSDAKAYALEMNGNRVGFNVSLKEALLNREWDVITVQQVSHLAPNYNTYQPYLNKLAEYVRECAPKAKLVVHQTWAYEQDSKRLNEMMGYKDQKEMFRDIENSYALAVKDIGADFIIPSGELFLELLSSGIEKVHRDSFHASLGLGRYALGMLWYAMLTGNDISNNNFSIFDEEVTVSDREIVKECVNRICKK